MNRCRDAPSGRIEVKWMDKLELDVLAGGERLMRIGQRHERLAPILEVDVVLIAEVFDAMDAADDAAAVSRLDQQVLGADADGLGPGRRRELGNGVAGRKLICGIPSLLAT